MAQIMRFHKKPANYRWEEYGVNVASSLYDLEHYQWTWESKSSAVINDIGLLMYRVGKDAGIASYTPSGSGVPENVEPTTVPRAFRNFGYAAGGLETINVATLSHHLEYIKKPVYTSGYTTQGVSRRSGHAWVVDGLSRYVDYTEQYYDAYYQGQRVGHIKVRTINFYLTNTNEQYFHCNWGWDGDADGWYWAGTFNPSPYNFNQKVRTLYVN